jgi:hypothetical protein
VSDDIVGRDELRTAIEARRELGDELEPQVVVAAAAVIAVIAVVTR